MPMGFLDRVKAALGMGDAESTAERGAAGEAQRAAPGGGEPPEAQAAPEPATGVAQKGTAATGAGTGDPVPDAVPQQTDPAFQSASAEQTPEEQTEAAAADPAGTIEPGTEGQDQEPR
jgi:hypothetical protein